MFKVNNKDTRKTPIASYFIFNLERISHLVLVFTFNFEQVNVAWVICSELIFGLILLYWKKLVKAAFYK